MQLVILDRDGVINQDSHAYIKSPAEWQPIPGSLEAIARLNRADYTVAVASNQSGIGRGLFDTATLEQIHQKMTQALAQHRAHLDGIFVCPHLPDAHCDCRKPKPGLLKQIATHFGTELQGVPVIGDSLRDVEAARAVGARPLLVLSGHSLHDPAQLPAEFQNVPTYPDLAAAVDALLEEPA